MRILIDLRTGEPVLDFEGNLKETNISRSYNQYLDVLFHTPFGEEQLLPTWGLDIRSIIKASGNLNWEAIIKYLFVDAISSRKEPLVDSVESIELSRKGNELTTEIHTKSKYGTTSKTLLTLFD